MVLNKAAECEVSLLEIDEVRASKNNKVGTIDVYDTMIVEFDCHIGKVDSSGEVWESVFHIGNSNGIRQPGMWFHTTADDQDAAYDGFTYVFGTTANANRHQEPSRAGDAFTDNSVVRFKSIQTQGTLTIWENGEIMFEDSNWGARPTYQDQAVYVGDPWYGPADVVLKNLKISTVGDCDCSAVDIDGYLTQCSKIFDRTLPEQISDLQDELARVEGEYKAADTQFSSADDDLEARISAIEATLERVADVDGTAEETTPIIDFNNHILLFSLFVNIILIILACYMYSKYKVNNMKVYGKVAAFVDSDTENQPLHT